MELRLNIVLLLTVLICITGIQTNNEANESDEQNYLFNPSKLTSKNNFYEQFASKNIKRNGRLNFI
jgi:hypothetical protein